MKCLRSKKRLNSLIITTALVDLPGFGRRIDMPESDQEDDASAARNAHGGSRPRAGRVPVRDDERGKRQWSRSEFLLTRGTLARALVNQDELAIDDAKEGHGESVIECASTLVQRGEYRAQTGIWRMLSLVSVRTIKGSSSAAWMDMYDHDRDTLEDILYH
jgi:hypothetical protein